MQVNAINNHQSFKSTTQNKPKQKKQPNYVAITGGLALGALGATAITGFAKMRKPHLICSTIAIASAAAHILSLKPKTYPQIPQKTLNYNG